VYPKRTERPLYRGLVTQCAALGIPFVELEQLQGRPLSSRADVVLDALFGFSFSARPLECC
jgi:NAD(P)H-hydrate epimerase